MPTLHIHKMTFLRQNNDAVSFFKRRLTVKAFIKSVQLFFFAKNVKSNID